MSGFSFLLISFISSLAFAKIYKLDGSSTVYPISEAMVEEYVNARKNNTKITIGVSGTGGGFKKFCRGELDIAEASRPIKESEIKTCAEKKIEYIEIAVAYDATVIAVHPSNKLTEINVSELKKIWQPESQHKITRWNEVNSQWPDLNLKLFGAGTDSGTFEYFTEVIVGKSKSSRGDYTASEDDNMIVQGIANEKGAIGYVPYAYYAENSTKLKALAVVNPKTQKAVLPSGAAVMDKSYAPLSRPLYLYVRKDSLQDPVFLDFVKFYITSAAEIVPSVKYIPLDKSLYEQELKKLL